MINNAGTLVLSFMSPKDREEFKKYCQENDIKFYNFLGSDEILSTNYRNFNVSGIPEDFFD